MVYCLAERRSREFNLYFSNFTGDPRRRRYKKFISGCHTQCNIGSICHFYTQGKLARLPRVLPRNRRLRTVTNVYVLSLAVADTMASTLVLPFSTLASGYRAWPFSFNFCQFNGFISYLWGTMSINILALTAVNRYICIVKPHLYPTMFTRKKTFFSFLSVLLLTFTSCLSATLTIPILFQWYPLDLAIKVTRLEVRAGVAKSGVGFVGLAMSLIIFCYGSVYRTIKRHNSVVSPAVQDTTSQATVSPHEIQASRVLLVTVIGFGVCWIH